MHMAPARLSLCVLLACVLLLTAIPTSAFFFNLPIKTTRCFYEEIPTNTNFEISYELGTQDSFSNFVDVVVSNHEKGGPPLWSQLGMMKGTYNSVLATEGDVLSICFTSRVIPGGNVKQITARTVYFKVKVGAETVDWATVARTEKLKPMELKLRMLEDNLRALHKEYDYYKEEEQNLRNTNEYMTARVLWMSVIVIVIFVLFSVWQLKHLKKFFKKKRMID